MWLRRRIDRQLLCRDGYLVTVKVRMTEMVDWETPKLKKDTNKMILNHLLRKVTHIRKKESAEFETASGLNG